MVTAAAPNSRNRFTVAVVAAFLRPGHAELVTKNFEQALTRLAEKIDVGAVEARLDLGASHGLPGLRGTLERPVQGADGEDACELLPLEDAAAHVIDRPCR